MFGNAHSLGFLGAAKASDAEYLIGQTEQLVTALGPTEAELKPAEEALEAAKALYTAKEYSKAVAQAERAATLAVSLNERFIAYMATWRALQACREELQELGFPTEGLEAALAVADQEVARAVEGNGAVFPNYLGATEMLERATGEVRTLVAHARETSREIFLATLAVEALSDSPSKQAPSWLAIRLEQMVEQSTRELALGHLPAAYKTASEARSRADDALAGATRAWEVLDMADVILDGLGAEGRVAVELTEKIGAAREALALGFPDRSSAHVVARHLSDEVASFAKRYPRARKVLDRAERVHARLRQDGFSSHDVDVALSEARRALGEGDWTEVREKVACASQVFLQLRSDQQTLTRAITEIDERVSLLKGFRLPLLPMVQEILSRAKEEIRSGRISGANEDLLRANTLMLHATRTGS